MQAEVPETSSTIPADMLLAGALASIRPAPTIVEKSSPTTTALPPSLLPRSRSPLLGRQARAVSAANGLSASGGPIMSTEKLFAFGIATDVQYADLDEGFSHGGQPR